jgi:hypothetical protein
MVDLDERYMAKAQALVFKTFPEMHGTNASVSLRRSHSKELLARRLCLSSSMGPLVTSGRPSECRPHYVVTFQRDVPLPGGGKIKRLVRVTMDEAGEILRLTSSK